MILDFDAGGSAPGTSVDIIDLSAFDAIANNGVADDAFTFIGGSAFFGAAGELREVDDGDGTAVVSGDVNGDAVATLRWSSPTWATSEPTTSFSKDGPCGT